MNPLLMNLRRLNLAEALAFFRVVSFPIILLLIFLDLRTTTAWLYLMFFSTDALDGICARLFNMESELRARFDTLGDILYLLTGLIGYYAFEKDHFEENLLLLGLVLGLYLLQFLVAMGKWGRPSTYHTWLAKLATFSQVAFFVWMFFFLPLPLLFYLSVALSLLDAAEDILITLYLKKYKSNIRGLPWLLRSSSKEPPRE